MVKRLLPPKGTPEFEAEVSFYLNSDAATRQQRAISLGFSNPSSYTIAMERAGVFLSRAVPKSMSRRYDKPPIIREPCLIIFDTQIPYQDANFLNNLLELASAWGINREYQAAICLIWLPSLYSRKTRRIKSGKGKGMLLLKF